MDKFGVTGLRWRGRKRGKAQPLLWRFRRLCLSLCLSVSGITEKVLAEFFWYGTRNNLLNFVGDPDPGIFFHDTYNTIVLYQHSLGCITDPLQLHRSICFLFE